MLDAAYLASCGLVGYLALAPIIRSLTRRKNE